MLHYREFYIKKRNGKQRSICAPTKETLAYQRSILPALTTKFTVKERNNNLTNTFHGFIKNRNCVTAALKHTGYKTTIGLDISNCFDSIKAIDALPNTTVYDIEKLQHADGTLAQGFATSPVLACIYLIDPIKEIKYALDALLDNYAITVYADDIHISSNEEDYEVLNLIILIVSSIMEKYKLTINKRKTRILKGKYGNRRILGIQVGETLHPNRKLRKKIRAARFQKNGPSLGGLVTASRLLLPKVLRS